MGRIIARSRIGFWTFWQEDGVLLLNARDARGSTITVAVPEARAADLAGDHARAHATVTDLVAHGDRLPTARATPVVGSMGSEPEPHEHRPAERDREEPRRLAA